MYGQKAEIKYTTLILRLSMLKKKKKKKYTTLIK